MSETRSGAEADESRLPPVVWRLGWASLLNDVSSEIVAALLPLYLAGLGTGGVGIGLVGGVEEATRSLLSVASGWLSDRLRRRLPFLFGGYGVSALAKTLLAATGSWPQVLGLRALDRVGKAGRTPPRDAMIAAAVPARTRGRAFGVHRALDTTGAVLGSLVALVAVAGIHEHDLRPLMLAGGLFGFLSLLPLIRLRNGAATARGPAEAPSPQPPALTRGSPDVVRALRWEIFGLSLFAAGQLSYLFFLLDVHGNYHGTAALGLPVAMYVVYQAVQALFSTPLGRLSDRVGREPVLVGGMALFAAMALGFVAAHSLAAYVPLFAAYGVAAAAVQANQRALVADRSPETHRGVALGALETGVGVAALAGNAAAGGLMQAVGPRAAFVWAAVLAAAGALVLASARRRRRTHPPRRSM